ncbi:MAG: DNA-processing protein DprA [Pseudomonadota bacterium]
MTPAEAAARLRLARTDGIGPAQFATLLNRYGSAQEAIPRIAARFPLPTPAAIDREMEATQRLGARYLHLGTEDYPALLGHIPDAPPVLACLGDPGLLGLRAIAIVGARNASASGRRIAETIAEAAAEAGLLVVSGLARGIDAAAHAGALRRGATVAAIAGGLDKPYPPEHAALQAQIADSGCILAEAPLGTAPLARHFPRRNRIVAGLALGTIVIEAAARSGSLITARLTLEYGRELFAVPGSPLDLRNQGSNDLIRQGAYLTEGIADILANLPAAPVAATRRRSLVPLDVAPQATLSLDEDSPEAAQVLGLLGNSPVAVDDLLRRCHLSPSVVQAILLDLELAGRVETSPGPRVALRPPGP